MQIPALIMAGGKGKRLELPIEKPLLPLKGKPLIGWVIEAAKSAKSISQLIVVTSENTTATERWCISKGFKVIKTDAKGYHDDLKQALAVAQIHSPVMVVSADVPALTGEFFDKVIAKYEAGRSDALTVLVPVEKRVELGLSISSKYPFEGKNYCVAGINVINAAKINEEKLSESALVSTELEAILNVNTIDDLRIAEEVMLTLAK
jgi:adenosylcobinamide-phosphate guanylyltransferase